MTIFFLQSKFKPKLGIRITIIFFYVNPKPTSLLGFKIYDDFYVNSNQNKALKLQQLFAIGP